jgi:hypothetical protein
MERPHETPETDPRSPLCTPRPLPGDPDWYVFELIAIQRAATANLQARMAKMQLGHDYQKTGQNCLFGTMAAQ